MKKLSKALPSEEQIQQLNSSINESGVSYNEGTDFNQKNSYEKKLTQYEYNCFILILLALLIALGGVTTYRYIQLVNKSEGFPTPNFMRQIPGEQTVIGSQHIIENSQSEIKASTLIKMQKSQEDPFIKMGEEKLDTQEPKQIQIKAQHPVEQQSQIPINAIKDSQEKKDLTEEAETSQSQQHSSLDKNSDASEGSSNDNTPGIKQIQDITENDQNQQLHKEGEYAASDLFDPIIRVREKIGKNFNAKFQDTIYIKKGTNITQEQYYNAKDRMEFWKYFNVKTKQFKVLQLPPQAKTQENSQSMPSQEILKKMINAAQKQQQQYENKYNISKYQQIPFCLIIPSFRNSDKFFRNLNSIFQQDYDNYHVIYIDDASKDGTAEAVRDYIKRFDIPQSKMKFIENQVNKKALPNIDYAARELCKSGQIMAIIDGDDYLIGRQVFKMINAQYQQKSLLALYTNHLRVHQPIYLKVGTCVDYPAKVKKARSYRHIDIFPASHLRTFYVDLYWKIKKRDLKDTRGQYFYAANDFAIMMPVLEMAGEKFQYLPQLTYVYDAGTGYNNFQTKTQMQARNFKTTKRRHKYPKLLANELDFTKLPQKQI